MPYCSNCGRLVDEEAKFCSSCGDSLAGPEPATESLDLTQAFAGELEALPTYGPEPATDTPPEISDVCDKIIEKCDEIEAELRNGFVVVRKAVEGDVKWGGLIFNPEDILKALGRFQRYFNSLLEEGEPLSLSTTLLETTTTLMQQGRSQAEIDAALAEANERVATVSRQVVASGNWLSEFYVAVCSTGSARSLLPLLPPFAWDEERPSKAGLKPRSFLDFFLGRD